MATERDRFHKKGILKTGHKDAMTIKHSCTKLMKRMTKFITGIGKKKGKKLEKNLDNGLPKLLPLTSQAKNISESELRGVKLSRY